MVANATFNPRFSLGRVIITPGAGALLASQSINSMSFLSRHICGDWGDLDADDAAMNEAAISSKDRILSAYRTSTGEKLWIITDAGHEVTTLLLPEEY